MSYEKYLTDAGLTEAQAEVYEALLTHGRAPARLVASRTTLKRGLAYKVLDQLVEMNLIEKDEPEGKIAEFTPKHPNKLREMAEQRIKEAEQKQIALSAVFDQLVSNYNLISGRPGVRFFEGMEGLQDVYDDINMTRENLLLFRSVFDDKHQELDKLVSKQIAKQISKGIKTKALTPRPTENLSTIKVQDEKNLVERRIIKREQFSMPAQVIVYGNKTALTSLADKNEIITTLVDNQHIAETFRVIFDYIWQTGKTIEEEVE